MKKYLGTSINAFCAVITVVICFLPVAFGAFVLKSYSGIGAKAVFAFLVFFSLFFMYYISTVSSQLFSWGKFGNDFVEVFTPFKKRYRMEYSKCRDIGVAYYVHGVMNSAVGTKQKYIYLSYATVDAEYKNKINLYKPTKPFIKLAYSEKTYNYLLSVLPPEQAKMLSKNTKVLNDE